MAVEGELFPEPGRGYHTPRKVYHPRSFLFPGEIQDVLHGSRVEGALVGGQRRVGSPNRVAPERGRHLPELVERHYDLLAPPADLANDEAFEDFEVLAQEGGGASYVAPGPRIELLQDR